VTSLERGRAESISKSLSLDLSRETAASERNDCAPDSVLPSCPFLYAFSFAPIDLVFLARESLRPANPARVSDLLTLFANATRTAVFVRNCYPVSLRLPHGLDIQISLIDLRNKSPGWVSGERTNRTCVRFVLASAFLFRRQIVSRCKCFTE